MYLTLMERKLMIYISMQLLNYLIVFFHPLGQGAQYPSQLTWELRMAF